MEFNDCRIQVDIICRIYVLSLKLDSSPWFAWFRLVRLRDVPLCVLLPRPASLRAKPPCQPPIRTVRHPVYLARRMFEVRIR